MVYLLATALVRAAAADPEAPPVEFHIEGGDATTTLTEFSRQARLQLLFDYNVVKGHKTKPLDGTLSPAEALRRLLADTDLDFDFVNERTLAVMQRKAATGDGAKSAGQPKPAKRLSRQSKSNKLETDTPGGPEEVVRITGTYIRDKVPVGQEIISAGRDDIDATGAATPADFLSTLPQTFGGGPNQDTYIGQEAQTNSGLGVGENLRGLGARATLVLIDGRRVAPSGSEGEFVDIENIPMGAIERIDILPDSASATYGADAVGGVVNFILRKNFDGAETILRGGSGTRGDLQEYLFSQTLGKKWDGGSGLVSFEFYDRGALPAADRTYAVSDLTRFGGGNFNTNFTNPGNIVSPFTGQTWAIPAGQNGAHLTAADLVAGTQNLQNTYLGGQIIPSQQRWNLYIDWRQGVGDRMTVFTDLLLGHRDASETVSGAPAELIVPPTNPFYVNPTGMPGPVMVDYNFGKDLGPVSTDVGIDTLNATVGLDFDAGASWDISVYGSFVREKQNYVTINLVNTSAAELALADPVAATALNPFGDGSFTSAATLNGIRTNSRFWLDSQLQTADLTADGPIAELPGGPLKLAVGVDRRNQFFTTSTTASSSAPAMTGDLSRSVLSTFGELVAPVFSDKNAIPGLARLEFSAATRYEDYSTFGDATTPKLGVLWSPSKGLSFRGTWSRAVRPPTLSDLDTNRNQAESVPLPNPTAPGGATPTLVWLGGNATVQPERATSWTGGLDFAPPWFSGLTLGLTYFNTVFTDRIQSTMLTTNVSDRSELCRHRDPQPQCRADQLHLHPLGLCTRHDRRLPEFGAGGDRGLAGPQPRDPADRRDRLQQPLPARPAARPHKVGFERHLAVGIPPGADPRRPAHLAAQHPERANQPAGARHRRLAVRRIRSTDGGEFCQQLPRHREHSAAPDRLLDHGRRAAALRCSGPFQPLVAGHADRAQRPQRFQRRPALPQQPGREHRLRPGKCHPVRPRPQPGVA